MRTTKIMVLLWAAAFFCALLAGCAARTDNSPDVPACRLVIEQSAAFTAESLTAEVPAGQNAVFTLHPAEGFTLLGADYEGAQLERKADGSVTLTLPNVRYSVSVRVEAEQTGAALYYHANGGQRLDGGDAGEWLEQPAAQELSGRSNTSQGTELFAREGFTLIGWNTAPDGSGTAIGLGSRAEAGAHLYAQWAQWIDAEEFAYTVSAHAVTITGWSGTEKKLVVPAEIDGLPVTVIAAGAFADAPCERVILPDTLRRVEPDAFAGSAVEEVTLFDSLSDITDYAFRGCGALRTLHINAASAPVYDANYFASFADKFDRLQSLSGKKLVLFSGSSARFGYDSAALSAAFPDYGVVNMGVFAYTNAVPQLLLILRHMDAGDLLLLSPEFDAAKRQFCTTDVMDAEFFCMMEANYDMAAQLDLRQVSGTFSALGEYLKLRAQLTPGSYSLSPADFDEDGAPVETPSYNEYGDYILYRPNADTDEPIYGLEVEYTVRALPKDYYLVPFNAMCARFSQKGVRVLVTYSPRNSLAVSQDSTPQAIEELDAYLRANLDVPVITKLSDSLLPGRYFYGTDNHLSTEGVALRTQQVIEALKQEGIS